MKSAEILLGHFYAVKVSGQVQPVRITDRHFNGGFVGVSVRTNRQIRIRGAGRIRYLMVRLSSGVYVDGRLPCRGYAPCNRHGEPGAVQTGTAAALLTQGCIGLRAAV
jgi:hypothetical protein